MGAGTFSTLASLSKRKVEEVVDEEELEPVVRPQVLQVYRMLQKLTKANITWRGLVGFELIWFEQACTKTLDVTILATCGEMSLIEIIAVLATKYASTGSEAQPKLESAKHAQGHNQGLDQGFDIIHRDFRDARAR